MGLQPMLANVVISISCHFYIYIIILRVDFIL